MRINKKNKVKKAGLCMLGIAMLLALALATTACYEGSDPEGFDNQGTTAAIENQEPNAEQANNADPAQAQQQQEQQNAPGNALQPNAQPVPEQQQAQQQVQQQAQPAQQQQQQIQPVQQPEQQQQISNDAYYEGMTEPADENEAGAPDVKGYDDAWEYEIPVVECENSPSGYHSWIGVYEWYGPEGLINTGSTPASDYFTQSIYLYDVCEYCGDIR